jgi:hypothetical protein
LVASATAEKCVSKAVFVRYIMNANRYMYKDYIFIQGFVSRYLKKKEMCKNIDF